jgi:hypothetical protein
MRKTTYAFGTTVQNYNPVWPGIMMILSLAAIALPVGKR